MSVLKLAAKRARANENAVAGSSPLSTAEGSDLPTAATPTLSQSEMMKTTAPKKDSHPKGHRVAMLSQIWATMDADAFLHLTDTLALSDVVVQPLKVDTTTGQYTTVTFIELVNAPNWKIRIAKAKMSIRDLLQMLYLGDCSQYDIQNKVRPTYDAWIKTKASGFGAKYGMVKDDNHSLLCQFIVAEDPTFSFHPECLGRCGLFYRKICYHSYKDTQKEETKLRNPAMVKCQATRGTFEFVFKVEILPVPDGYFKKIEELVGKEEEEYPASQPFDTI